MYMYYNYNSNNNNNSKIFYYNYNNCTCTCVSIDIITLVCFEDESPVDDIFSNAGESSACLISVTHPLNLILV